MLARLGQYLRLIAIWVMVLPFFGASLIANGVMPAAASNGVMMLVFCSGDDMVEVAVDAVTLEPITDTDSDKHPTGKTDPCAFAALSSTALAPQMALLRVPEQPHRIQTAFITETVLQAAAETGLPPSTGPPVTL